MFLNNLTIPIADFYDILLAKFYGKKYSFDSVNALIEVYNWDGKYYVTDYEVIDESIQ